MIKLTTRRGILAGITVGGAVTGLHPITRLWTTEEGGLEMGKLPRLDGELRAASRRSADPLPELDGELLQDRESRVHAADDYGRMVHREPLAVLMPGSVDDVVEMVRYANRHGLLVGVRGAGHATLGQSQTHGILIDMSALAEVTEASSDAIVVEAGATWRQVVEHGFGTGRAPRVVPADLGHTIGGILAIGGVTAATHLHGLVADSVLELDVVTGAGELLTCSERMNREVFEAALGGHGQAAIIVSATLRLFSCCSEVRTYSCVFAGSEELLEAILVASLDGRFDELAGCVHTHPDGSWAYLLEGTSFFDPDALFRRWLDASRSRGCRTRNLDPGQRLRQLGPP